MKQKVFKREDADAGAPRGCCQAAIAELDKTVAEATEIRTAEKAKNEVTIKEAKEAQVAATPRNPRHVAVLEGGRDCL